MSDAKPSDLEPQHSQQPLDEPELDEVSGGFVRITEHCMPHNLPLGHLLPDGTECWK